MIRRQCELLNLPRSTFSYLPQVVSKKKLALMIKIDHWHMEHPTLGCRKIAALLGIDKDHANRLMKKMGILAIYPKRKTTRICQKHVTYPYLLCDLEIEKPNHGWATDITYLPMAQGFMAARCRCRAVLPHEWKIRVALPTPVFLHVIILQQFTLDNVTRAMSFERQPAVAAAPCGSKSNCDLPDL